MCSFAVLSWEEPDKTAAFLFILVVMCNLFASVPPLVAFCAILLGIPLVAATLWILVAALWVPLYWELPNNVFRYIIQLLQNLIEKQLLF